MSLSLNEVALLTAECRDALVGGRVEHVHQSDEYTTVLTLYSRRRGKTFVLFSVRPKAARFHLMNVRPPAMSRPPTFCSLLRARLVGARLDDFRQYDADRVVELSFTPPARLEPELAQVVLVHELFGNRGYLLLLSRGKGSGDARIAGVLPAPSASDERRRVGKAYVPPQPSPARKDVASSGAPRQLDSGTSWSERVACRFAERDAKLDLEQRSGTLGAALSRELRRKRALIEKVRNDALRVACREDDRVRGELLKGVLDEVHRGDRSVEVVDYFDPTLPRVLIELDPALSPRENVERYFKRYRKARRAVPHIERRLAQLTSELETLESLQSRLAQARTREDLDELTSEARTVLRIRAAREGRKRAEAAVAGPRRFTSRDGVEILVGRNARSNDELTTRIARGRDYFLHVAGRPGAHVVVRLEREQMLPQETLLDAAQLALWYSLPERARRLEGERPVGDVDYAPVKFVRKHKGDRAGRVYLLRHKTLRVRLEPARLGRLLGHD